MLSTSVAAGTMIFCEGDVADCAYLIEDGWVEIFVNRDGEHQALARLGPGEVFGELGVIDNSLRSASAIAVKPTQMITVNAERIRQTIATADPFFAELMLKLVGRFRQVQNAMIDGTGGISTCLISDLGEGDPQLQRERDIADSIIHGEILPFLQPIVDLRDGKVLGFEALARGQSERLGILQPFSFLPLAKRTGLIRRIDLSMADHALGLCAAFGKGPDAPFVSVNISAWHLRNNTLQDTLRRMLAQHSLPASRVCVEITETVLLDDIAAAETLVSDLRSLGVKVALDDFGSGFSSLSLLARVPVDIIKIDRSLVEGIQDSPRRRAIMEAIVSLARSLDTQVIAEGVQNASMVEVMLEIGCTMGQGYHFSAPDAADAIMTRWHAAR
ncbi:Predicted signal transduction protein containing a membrane domain [Candidatus Terasakiella magnetica]|nr:Predicted signal transduction protein containing a membrane domain [Candidatus Terasakiella magnetica]